VRPLVMDFWGRLARAADFCHVNIHSVIDAIHHGPNETHRGMCIYVWF
jgi:hypothetical protein